MFFFSYFAGRKEIKVLPLRVSSCTVSGVAFASFSRINVSAGAGGCGIIKG
jgi:hypothetical protein